MHRRLRTFFCFAAATLAAQSFAAPFTLTVLHTNDMHAHFEATRVSGQMLGGYARQAALIARFRAQDSNVILLNAGDTFQGTIYFNTYQGLADLAFMNAVRYDAMAVGNHEFDKGPGALAEFARGATFPLLAANLDVDAEPLLKDLVKRSVVLSVAGERIGIVGAVTPSLPDISFVGATVRMLNLVQSCQGAIDSLAAQGIDKVVLLTHVGYGAEVELAKSLRGVDLLVGGHSHTLLGDTGIAALQKGPDYPTVAKNLDGDTVLVVQAWHWGLVLGRLQVTFDELGKVVRWAGGPVPVTQEIGEDPSVASMVRAFDIPVSAVKNQVIGSTRTEITREGPSNLAAQLIADAQLAATRRFGAVAAFINAGGVRAPLAAGDVTYGEALTLQPFGNTLVVLEVTGAELLAAIGRGVGTGGALLPSHGTSYAVTSEGVKAVVIDGKPLDLSATYRVTVNNFTAGGGDSHQELKTAKGERIDTGIVDIDALIDYIKSNSPLEILPENRTGGLRPLALAG